MTISVRLSEKDTKLMKTYAKMNNLSLFELIRSAVIEKIEEDKIIVVVLEIGHSKDMYE